jgi:predicted nucleic acid-binding Zn ribbon protein
LGAPKPSALNALFSHWEDIVGPTIAAQAWPVRVKDGVLRIGVTQPGWATQLTFLGPDLVRKVVAATGDPSVVRIEVKVVFQRPETTG